MDSSTDLISPEVFIQNDKKREDPGHQATRKRIREPEEHMPKLYYVFPPPAENLRQDLRKQALLLQQQLISEDQLDSDELQQLWHLMEQHVSETTLKNQRLINHSDYLRLQEVLTEKGRKFLTAQVFAQLLSDSSYLDLVEIDAIYEYTVQQMRLMQHRIELTLYDEVGQGYLRGFDLENYLIDLIPKLKQLQNDMLPSFQKFYICSVVKRFFFFLDPLRTGRISIPEMVASRMYTELLELREKSESSIELLQEQNPFTLPAVRSIYENYLSLDLDRNGLLSREELAAYGSGTLSSAFLDRVLEESHTYYDEMDYKSFLDFVYALEDRQTPAALHYLFRMLDVQHAGYLTPETVQHFVQSMQEQMQEMHQEKGVNLEDVNKMIFSMVKPVDAGKITLQDLSKCCQADTVVSILIEFHKFWAYVNHGNNPQNA